MATLTIRNLDESLKSALRVTAAHHGVSMEEQARRILRQALQAASADRTGLGQRLARRFQSVATDELPIPPRSQPRLPPSWDES